MDKTNLEKAEHLVRNHPAKYDRNGNEWVYQPRFDKKRVDPWTWELIYITVGSILLFAFIIFVL